MDPRFFFWVFMYKNFSHWNKSNDHTSHDPRITHHDMYSYLLPDRSKESKQKTSIAKKTCDPKWNQTFIYEDLALSDLKARSIELTIWDYVKLTSNEFLGGVRLNLATGM